MSTYNVKPGKEPSGGCSWPDLATIPITDWGKERKRLSKESGVPVGMLDKERERALRAAKTEVKELSGQTAYRQPIEGVVHHVNGADLLTEIKKSVENFLVLPPGGSETIALWVVASHAHDLFDTFPYLTFTSPTPGCGKTESLKVVSCLVDKPLHASNVSPSALFRVIDKHKPTLMIDEIDSFMREGSDMRNLLNAGHSKDGSYVIRSVSSGEGDDYEPRTYSVWGPKCMALIGKLPATLASRSITIPLVRALPDQKPERLRGWRKDELHSLAPQIVTWVKDNATAIQHATPFMDGVSNRARDNWEPLAAIAHAAGGRWTDAVAALITRAAVRTGEPVEGLGVQLIYDCLDHMKEFKIDRASSEELVHALAKREDRPWCEWRHDRPMTPRQLAEALEPFDVVPGTVRLSSGKTAKGYYRDKFERVAKHYPQPKTHTNSASTPGKSVSSSQARKSNGFNGKSSVTGDGDVTDKNANKSRQDNGCAGDTAAEGVSGEIGGVSDA